jgi:uncharacterized membrane protein YidH (DUF202 family)
MRPLGVVIIIIGIIMIAYTGFTYMTTEKVVDLGPIQIDKKESHPVQWSPIVGIVLLIGGVLMLVTGKKTTT